MGPTPSVEPENEVLARSAAAGRWSLVVLQDHDRIARRILDEHLPTAGAGEGLVAKVHVPFAYLRHERVAVLGDDDEAVPAPRFGATTVGHWARG